jgi:hypothetical protein
MVCSVLSTEDGQIPPEQNSNQSAQKRRATQSGGYGGAPQQNDPQAPEHKRGFERDAYGDE